MHQRHVLLYELHIFERIRYLRASITHPRRLRIGRLPNLRVPGLLRHRTLRQEKSHDVLCSCLLYLLDRYSHRSWLVRKRRRLICPGIGGCGVLFLVFRFIRNGVWNPENLSKAKLFADVIRSWSHFIAGHSYFRRKESIVTSISLTYQPGVLGVPWLYPTEINALEMRTKGALWITVDMLIPN